MSRDTLARAMATDRIETFFQERIARRLLMLSIFIGGILVFRRLLPLLAFFVAFEGLLALTAGWISRKFSLSRPIALLTAVVWLLCGIALTLMISAGRIAQAFRQFRTDLPERVREMSEHPWFEELRGRLPEPDRMLENAQHYAADIAKSAAAVGHLALLAVIGLVLAIVYYLDEEKIRAFQVEIAPKSIIGTMIRWLMHLAEAVSLTIQIQLIVAVLNTIFTLPILLLLRIQHIPLLMLIIFISGLIPVVGNILSGAILSILAYQANGWLGVTVFIVLTFVLHKVESYYLNPRLAARHVQLPGFVLILSLIAWEHLLGFVGLFVSFPFLYVAGKIREELNAPADTPVPPV